MTPITNPPLHHSTNHQSPILSTFSLTAGYKRARDIIRGINVVIEEGEFVGLFGTNGAGKSTVLKAIMGLLYQKEGQILYYPGNGASSMDIIKHSADMRSRMGIKYLTQDARIFPNFTVKDNLMFAVNYDNNAYEQRIERIFTLFPDMGENSFLKKKGDDLSGGQREKTAIAMVLITEPRLLMLDEPSSGLSPNIVGALLKGIRDFQKSRDGKMGIILIEQQKLFDAKNICDSLYLMKNGSVVDLEGNISREKLKADSISEEDLERFMLVEA
ncbi:MAG: ATP-binding cassette domain-containing protein [Candidatus Aminicenantes bacterium]|nr:ATP-binding cassette domain-containing protein [Candidatus Aminicenantes bacterium]